MSARQARDGAKTPIPNQDLCSTSWNVSRDQRGLKGGSEGTRTRGLRIDQLCPASAAAQARSS